MAASRLVMVVMATIVIRDICAVPITYLKGDVSPRNTLNQNIQSKLTKLKELLKDLEEEEHLLNDKGIWLDKPSHPLKLTPEEQLPGNNRKHETEVTSEEDSQDEDHVDVGDLENSLDDGLANDLESKPDVKDESDNLDKKSGEERDSSEVDDEKNAASDGDGKTNIEAIPSGEAYKQMKEFAMRRFLNSLSDDSLKNLKVLKELDEDTDQVEKKEETPRDSLDNGVYLEHALTDSELNDANWRNLVDKLENQRDQLIVQKQMKTGGDELQGMKPFENNGVFGQFTSEVKAAVEKNLLSDVALAIHSGISIDDLIADIMGKEKGAIM